MRLGYPRFFRNLGLGLSVFALLAFLLLHGCVQFRDTTAELHRYFDERKLKPEIGFYQAGGRDMRYLRVGGDTSATILFIHARPVP